MTRFGMFNLGRRDPRGEEQRPGRRLVRRATAAAAVAAAVLAVGLVGMQGASASGPMTVSGTLSDNVVATQTVAAKVNGTACAGASQTLAVKEYQYSVTLAASCGSTGQAVTFTVNGSPAGLKTQGGATCLQFASGSVSGVTVVAGGTPDTSCAVQPTPQPLPKSLVLTPNGTWHSSKYYQSWESGLCDIGGDPFFPSSDWANAPSDVAVGYSHFYDGGICWAQQDSFDRGAVQFDWDKVNSYVQAHGFKSATLTYTGDAATIGCAGQIEEASDDLNALHPFPAVIPDGKNLTPAPEISLNKGSLDVGGVIAFGEIFGGVDPHMHFIFIGPDEGLSAQDNNTCTTVLSNFKLTIVPEH